ncbi:hypothetical protein [Sedimentitalea arenosa]|uniref:Uncharacterized protein n=1 Tax=Sedimentitalea arenosa TaxID=2798803 RepID=A0A8J7LVV0_9RHOB|nr:hypothetical protein [Arenibacterium arenosum]MBJ6371460.1 hypothetical protein [Arenibacterium arenosum]
MQIILHTGAHGTDNDKLLRCLLRNQQQFAARGVSVPGPARYRDLLDETLDAMQTAAPAPDARAVLMDALLDDGTADRMILSNAFFFGPLRFAIRDGEIYPDAPARVAHLQRLFPGDRVEMFMALRNPASLLPAVIGKIGPHRENGVLGDATPESLRWSGCLARIHEAAPDVSMTIWCNEDSPVLWAAIIREMAGLPPGEKIVGGFDLLSEIMTPEGMKLFRAHLQRRPRMSEPRKRRVMMAFLEKHAIEEKIEEELDMPGWTDAEVDELTRLYDSDIERIRTLPGVNFIAP